jgi:hypothetical protein
VKARLETKKLTALAQQNITLPSPRQQKTAKDRQETPKSQLEQKTAQARRETKTLTNRLRPNKKFTQAQQKNPLPPLKQKAAKSKQIIAVAKQSHIKIKPRELNKTLCLHRSDVMEWMDDSNNAHVNGAAESLRRKRTPSPGPRRNPTRTATAHLDSDENPSCGIPPSRIAERNRGNASDHPRSEGGVNNNPTRRTTEKALQSHDRDECCRPKLLPRESEMKRPKRAT